VCLLQQLPNRVGNVVMNAAPPPVPSPQALPCHCHHPILPAVKPADQQAGHEEEGKDETPPPQAPPPQVPPPPPSRVVQEDNNDGLLPLPPLPPSPRPPPNRPCPTVNTAQATHRHLAGINTLASLLRVMPRVPSIMVTTLDICGQN
jgi:hypothetical protein